jgi:hypothetical protein
MKGRDRRERFFDTAESETLGMWGNSMRENREALQTPALDGSVGRSKKAKGRKVDMHVCGESDGLVVPTKRANKAGAYALVAESAEGRRSTKGIRTTSALVPDAEPGKRVTGFVARTTSCVLRNGWPSHEPEVRAV